MTEQRCFQNTAGDIWQPLPEQAHRFESDPAYTEVQVAPLDATVIRRDELPEVTAIRGDYFSVGRSTFNLDQDPNELRAVAREFLAGAERIEANPPVDEAQVEALADLLAGIPMEDTRRDALRLYRFGVRVEVQS